MKQETYLRRCSAILGDVRKLSTESGITVDDIAVRLMYLDQEEKS